MVNRALLAKLLPNTLIYIVCSVTGLMRIKSAGRMGLPVMGLYFNGLMVTGCWSILWAFAFVLCCCARASR